ncbi:MAG: UbiA family prenyltransferase, partial [Thermoanaerobaculia bacterium]
RRPRGEGGLMGSATPLLTRGSPYPARLRAYLAERFPLLGNVLLIASYYSSNQFLAQALLHPGEPMRYGPWSLPGAVALLCFFFHLRVFDEHKDFEEDSRNYPERVLQRGLVTLKDLRRLGAAAIALEVILGALRGWGALSSVLAAQLFSLLMLKEFFAGGWLRRRFLLYATSHMLIMPLLGIVVFGFAAGLPAWEAPAWFWLYALVGFFVTFNWEVSRKIRAPEEEREGVDSYTKVFGTLGAANVVLAIRVIDTALVSLVGWRLGASGWFYLVLVALFGVCLVGYFQYRLRPSPRTAKRMEVYAAAYIVAFDLTLAVELAARHGIAWGGE